VPLDGFFGIQILPNLISAEGSAPEPVGGAHDAPQESAGEGDTTSPVPTPLNALASRLGAFGTDRPSHFQMLPPAIAASSNHCYNANLLKLLTLQYSIRCYHHSRGIKALTCILINSHKNWCHAQELKLPLVSIIAQL